MKYLKKFNESIKEYKMDDYLWLPLFITRDGRGLDCKIFSDQNMMGYGLGLRGDYFSQYEFSLAMGKIGDTLGRKLYTINDFDIILKDLDLISLPREEAVDIVIDVISNTRKSYSSARPAHERSADLYVELSEIKDLLL